MKESLTIYQYGGVSGRNIIDHLHTTRAIVDDKVLARETCVFSLVTEKSV